MSAFFQWHVGCCRRANTSLMGFVSAWRCYADEHCLFFPARDSRELMRLRQTIKGAQLRYPHEPRRDLPLTLDLLDIVADGLGIRCLNDYSHCNHCVCGCHRFCLWVLLLLPLLPLVPLGCSGRRRCGCDCGCHSCCYIDYGLHR